jgi:hypothetical protein
VARSVLGTLAALCCLRAQIYEVGMGWVRLCFRSAYLILTRNANPQRQSQDNRARAVAWCKHALRLDVYCVEALEFLVERKLLR